MHLLKIVYSTPNECATDWDHFKKCTKCACVFEKKKQLFPKKENKAVQTTELSK